VRGPNEMIEELIAKASDPEEWTNQVIYLPLK
jgi:hypothetical protein